MAGLVNIQNIIDVEPLTTPTFDYMNSMARHIKAAQAELSALEAGSEPGFAASIDLRWFAEDVGVADALEIVPLQEPESGDDLVSGMFYDVLLAATNTGAGVTLEVRNTADDVQITKNVKKWNGDDLVAGDLVAGRIERFQYITDGGSLDEWRVFLLRDLINPMTTAGDLIYGAAGGSPQRLAKGTTGRHMRAGATGPEYGGDVDMDGGVLRGHGGVRIVVSSPTTLNNSTHRAVTLKVNNTTLTIDTDANGSYVADQQLVVGSRHASGGTVTAASGVLLNGVDGGSVTINEDEAYALLRDASDDWWMPNATAAAP